MKARGILFSREMIHAIQRGQKSVTRRIDLRWLRVRAGDHLYVRETWHPDIAIPIFAADYPEGEEGKRQAGVERWRPSIFLPRDDARIWLEASEDAREERLHDITAEEVDAEGFGGDFPERAFPNHNGSKGWFDGGSSMIECFAELWDAINGDRAPWKSNPTIARVAFKQIARPS